MVYIMAGKSVAGRANDDIFSGFGAPRGVK